ncbi:MAG TPA: hypothetical protein VJ927_04305 [Actinomycetota bacterium]|nr:hypothetical protein [Actinomycetota bacterium]
MKRYLSISCTVGLALAVLLSNVAMALAAPANDSPESAQEVASVPFSATVNNSEATTGQTEPTGCGMGKAVWYSFTPSQDMRVEASTGGNVDTVIGVYTGTAGSMNMITCNDWYYGENALIRWNAEQGTTYMVAVGGYSQYSSGEIRVNIKSIPTDLEMTLEFDPVQWISAASENPVVLGTLDCSVPVDNVLVSLYLEQDNTYAYADTPVDCDGPTRFLTSTSSGDFKGKLTGLTGTASFDGEDVEATASVMLVTCTRFGTLGPDFLSGSSRKDKLCGLDGNDIITGGAGDDTLRGGNGNDTLRGGDGNDLIFGGLGDDRLFGQAGTDTLRGNEKNDVLDGGSGSDTCNGDQGFNRKKNC